MNSWLDPIALDGCGGVKAMDLIHLCSGYMVKRKRNGGISKYLCVRSVARFAGLLAPRALDILPVDIGVVNRNDSLGC